MNTDRGRIASRLARLSRRQRIVVGVVWILVLLFCLPLAQKQNDELTAGGFEVGGSQSEKAEQTLRQKFPELTAERLTFVLEGESSATRADYQKAYARVREAVSDEPRIALPADAESRLEQGGEVVALPLEVKATVRQAIDIATDLQDELDLNKSQDGPVTLQLVGRPAQVAGVNQASKENVGQAEGAAFPLVLVILLGVFGSLVAALLPLALGFLSVTITGAAIYLLSTVTVMSVFVTSISSMIGIGVAVDYSLFMLARYREEIARGASEPEAREAMLKTSGRAVAFAGGTVIVSLASLFLIDSTILRSMAAGAIIVVSISVLVAVTLLPTLIAALGARLHKQGRVVGAVSRRLSGLRGHRATEPFWSRWTTRVTRRPVLWALIATGTLLMLSFPALSLEIGANTLRQLPKDDDLRHATELAASELGAGADSPVVVTADFNDGATASEQRSNRVTALGREIARDPQVERVNEPLEGKDGRSFVLIAVPRSDGESDAALDLIERLRGVVPESELANEADLVVGGTSATIVDASDQITDTLWKVILSVLILSYVILLLLLRSVLLPLKAILMNLLSVGAAYGVLVMVFQWRWLEPALGSEEIERLDLLVPPLVFAVVYGLSMDYEVFLLTRIRERFEATGDNRRAVMEGVAASARTITSAALIMVAVFGAFVSTNLPAVQQIGLGTAVAIAIDATITRLVLLPATMQLLGRWNWWLPGWLDRSLSALDRGARRARTALRPRHAGSAGG